jgi:hypothetical protein
VFDDAEHWVKAKFRSWFGRARVEPVAQATE